jgi:hypothetical protein
MKTYDPNKRPNFSFTYRELAGAEKLTFEKLEEARRAGWPTWERWLGYGDDAFCEGTYLVNCMTTISDRAGQPVIYSWELKMKLCDAMLARRNFPTPEDYFYVEPEVAQ